MTVENTRFARSGELGEWLARARHIHMLGICGAGMRVLAGMLLDLGYTVTGSDADFRGEGALALGLLGVVVSPPSPNSPIIDADLLVYSIAVPKNHPELLLAEVRGIPCVSRADLLGALSLSYRVRIGVAGTHGKSTVTAMTAAILAAAGGEPTVAAGAPLSPRGDGYLRGRGESIVFEACEYRRSFLSLFPTVAVLTNAEWDHPDCFPTPADALSAFSSYLALPGIMGCVLPAEDEAALALLPPSPPPILTFGLREGDVRALSPVRGVHGYRFTLAVSGRKVGEVSLRVPGVHNVKNALAAAAAALLGGVEEGALAPGLSGFFGIGRRTEYRGTLEGVEYYDDYAHHPTEIRAALTALREGCRGRLICLYQPHTFSRTESLLAEFSAALSLADLCVLLDPYAAREVGDTEGAHAALAANLSARRFPTPEVASLYIRGFVRPHDRVVVMGAGDVGARFFTGPLTFAGE